MGLSPSGDWFNIKSDTLVAGLDHAYKSVDDILFQASNVEELEKLLRKFFENCRRENVQLSEKKFRAESSVTFGGTTIETGEGVVKFRPEDDKDERIKTFPSPKTRSELKSFLGLMRTFDMWTTNLSLLSSEMAKLQSERNAFIWTEEHELEFQKIKEEQTGPKYVHAFDVNLPVEIFTDCSCLNGMPYILTQPVGRGMRQIIKCGLTKLTDAQTRWAMVELELASTPKSPGMGQAA